MYRIELAPGEEAALRTIDELAIGIRNGVITSRARIWHNAGQKWLPIQFHPHYQAALKQLEADSSSAVVAPPAPVVPAAVPTPKDERQQLASVPTLSAEPPSYEPAEATTPPPARTSDRPRSVWRPIGLLAGGLVLIAGARVVTSAAADDVPNAVERMAATVASPSTREMTAPSSVQAAAAPGSIPASAAIASSSDRRAKADSGTNALAAEPSTQVFEGGVVRGPDVTTAAPLPPPARRESSEDDDELPPIAPAPVVAGVPMPLTPFDTLD